MKKFSESNREQSELFFAIKLNPPAPNMNEENIRDLFRFLKKAYSGYFKRSQYAPAQNERGALFLDERGERRILVSQDRVEYSENRKFNNHKFNEISRKLYSFILDQAGAKNDDIRVLGKVFTYFFDLNEDSVEYLKNHLGIFKDKEVSVLELKTTIVEGDKNLHIFLNAGGTAKTDEDQSKDLLVVKFDFNNRDQESGISEGFFTDLIEFADGFIKNSSLDFLNNYLAS